VARELGGGGHTKAAGALVNKGVVATRDDTLAAIRKVL